jgi:hypothetical protein
MLFLLCFLNQTEFMVAIQILMQISTGRRVTSVTGFLWTRFAEPGNPVRPRDFDLQTQTAGQIADARDWTFSNVILKTTDGGKVSLADSERVTGLTTVPAVDLPRPDAAKRPFGEQDQN